MYTLFSEVLPKNDWLALFDNIIFNHPSFFLYCVAGYVISARGPLLSMKSLEDFQFFFHHRNSIQASQIVDSAKKLMKRTPKSKKGDSAISEYMIFRSGFTQTRQKTGAFNSRALSSAQSISEIRC